MGKSEFRFETEFHSGAQTACEVFCILFLAQALVLSAIHFFG